MSLQPDSEQSGSSQAGRSFAFPKKPLSSYSPATVVNPERRGMSPSVRPELTPDEVAIRRRLFPAVDTDSDANPSASDDRREPSGIELAHFVIEEPIGRGGMGAVFRSVDQRLQRVVALKVLSPDQSLNQNAVQTANRIFGFI